MIIINNESSNNNYKTQEIVDKVIGSDKDLFDSEMKDKAISRHQSDKIRLNVNNKDVLNDLPENFKQKVDSFVDALSNLSNPTESSVQHLVTQHFGTNTQIQNKAFWAAFDKVKHSDNSKLIDLLKGLASASVITKLQVLQPQSKVELQGILKSETNSRRHQEQTLWQAWVELKDLPEMESVVDLVRKELTRLMVINGFIRSILTSSNRPDLTL